MKWELVWATACVVCAGLVADAARPSVVLRFDDAHPARQWQALADVFDATGAKMSIALPAGHLRSQDQNEFLRVASAHGHEIMDHVCHHALAYYKCRDAQEFAAFAKDPAVAEANAKTLSLEMKYVFDRTHPGIRRFRGFVTNSVLVVSREEAKTFHRPDKIYVPALDRCFGFFDSPAGEFRLHAFGLPGWSKESRVSVPDVKETEMLYCPSRAFLFPDDVLRFQARRSREAFERLRLPAPRAWIQPGGWDPHLPAESFERVFVKEFGYTCADCIPGFDRSKAPPPARWRPYMFRPGRFFDVPHVTQASIRAQIETTLARGETPYFISHMNPSPKMAGGWDEWLAETQALLAWLKKKDIAVIPFSAACAKLAEVP